MDTELSGTPQLDDSWFKIGQPSRSISIDDPEWKGLSQLASDEAQVNRSELEKLYSDGSAITGEVRYHLLWRLSQLERQCISLERCANESPTDLEELTRIRRQVSEHTLQAVQLRQEARLLVNANRPVEPSASERKRSSGTSGRRYSHFAGV